jgi:hypothetical protein
MSHHQGNLEPLVLSYPDDESCPISQTCGMQKNPAINVEVGIASQIDRPFLAQFRPSLTEVFHIAWRGAPLEMSSGTKVGAQRPRTLKA